MPRSKRFRVAQRAACGTTSMLGSALLIGCATPQSTSIPAYVAPVDGPTARLLTRSSLPAGERYGVFLYADAEGCREPRRVGIAEGDQALPAMTLQADRPTTIEFAAMKPDRAICRVRWTFDPLPGKTYLLAGSATRERCVARVLDASDADDIKPEATALWRNGGAASCTPTAELRARRSSSPDAERLEREAVLRPGATAQDLQGLTGR
ncbi:hypothetical protein [Piscinibacter koreensis]|uniref:Lipoprotein n=1 Tax=Piscinibacter koreensis TaxID=2742824 RepID=A0A7Y6TV35_9BURK|nr:hypothetical protein [Schlegelella koreensis]NUZ04521.1 hypothetical protein [Schlegelella koreensis]